MTKKEYLKFALSLGLYKKVHWLLSVLTVTKESKDSKNIYPGAVVMTQWGHEYLDPFSKEWIKIDGTKENEPLYKIEDTLMIDNSWVSVIEFGTNVKTTVGYLLIHKLCIELNFKNKIPYFNKLMDVSNFESYIETRLTDDPQEGEEMLNDKIYVKEYKRFIDSLQIAVQLGQVCTYSATPKNLLAPPGIKEYREKLIKEYGKDKLKDPVIQAEFQNKLKKYDSDYLADDPSLNFFVDSKVKNIARNKLYLTNGAEMSFEVSSEIDPIEAPLYEGWPTDPKELVKGFNGSRAGSFSRGSETVNGGVAAKIVLRATNNLTVVVADCGSKGFISRMVTKDNYKQLSQRYLAGTTTLVTEKDAESYIGKVLRLRSPQYCRIKGNSRCMYCAGDRLTKFKNGQSIPLTEMSGGLLNASLKAMHGTVLSTGKLSLQLHMS